MAEIHHLPLHHNIRKIFQQHVTLNLQHIFMLVFLLMLVCSPSTALSYARCNSNQFTCNDGSCILQVKMCDGRLDCSDNSDEIDCDAKLCRKPNWFSCAQPMGPCLSADLKCNGIENCPGGEDEVDCIGHMLGHGGYYSYLPIDAGTDGRHSSHRNCSDFEYTCQSDKSCIPLDFMCDGKSDCHDGSDEVAGCLKAEANCTGFFCGSKKCLESDHWVCDGTDDCGDGSDERNCAYACQPEIGKYFCRDNVTCLELSQVCDGKPDCKDGSDESNRCSSEKENCKSKNCPTAAKCHMLPETGAVCICPKGFRLSMLENACVDINECLEDYGVCSQGCINTSGSYICKCDEGYFLRADNRTCEAHGEEALLLYTTQVAITAVHLRSKRVQILAKNLTKVIGVAYDGEHIYWTNIQNQAESIVRAKADGSEAEILLTSGIDAPEDLAVDWLTDNIYFSDNVMQHIAVCSNDALSCAVLVTIDVHQPRGIALWPQRAQMYWTDWGNKPMIARAYMDGSHSMALVSDNIHWPNGIALDMHNDRIYWVDAKLSTIESVRVDGTDRRLVLADIMKHPYGLAVFEENLYWSDWITKSVHKCNKFTGKDHNVVVRDRTIYAVHIYHAAKQAKVSHACLNTRCSHLCLLAQNNSFTCACPDGMTLSADQLRCVKTYKKQRLFIGIKHSLLEMEHTAFGRHTISQTHQLNWFIHEMAYNSVNGTIIIADNIQRTIFEYDVHNNHLNWVVRGNIGNITGIAFDHLAHNVYWTDAERHVVEVYSLRTQHRAIVSFFSGLEVPIGISIVPDDGIMFIALRSRRHVHIDQRPLSGQGEHVHILEDELGSRDIKFAVDFEEKTLYWADSGLGRISKSNYRNLLAHTFIGRLRRPYSLVIVDEDLFWSELKSSTIYWTHKSIHGPIKQVEIQVVKDTAYAHILPARIPLLASAPALIVDHPCQHGNGGCSHICVTLGKFSGACLCPPGLVFKDASNRTCIEVLDCEFRCRSGECLTLSRRCNGHKDCPDNSDEEACDAKSMQHSHVFCNMGQFMCHDAKECIENDKRCDGHRNCHDGSDEQHCEKFDATKKCHRHQHACDNGNCVDFSTMCDGIDDCGDNSDETNCKIAKGKDAAGRLSCAEHMFQCNSGTCIAKGWECDGKIDCTDGSDEHEKCELRDCPSGMHKCMLGQCVDAKLICDGHNDCGDHSDELNCDMATGKQQKSNCGDDQHQMFQCPSNSNICLELTAKCNGTAECPRGEDEADCGDICSINEFQCKSSKECIRAVFRCDHEKDCRDGSDELNCQRDAFNATKMPSNEHVCEADMYDCKDGRCVDLTRVCDGFPDCDTGVDEGSHCQLACKRTAGGSVCDHKCRATPAGAVCSCYHGYKLDADQRTCVDINECVEQDPCAQICENTRGSYRCKCYPDFMLRTDKTTCKSIESNSTIMFSTFSEVRSMSDQPIVLRIVWSANDTKISGFDLNVRKRVAYFSTANEDVLYKVELETGSVKAGLVVQMPTKVASDWITDNVYVISRAQRYEIKVCSFKEKMCGRILQASSRETIKALTVDAFNRRLFYVIIRSQSFNLPMSQIIIANLDGHNHEILHTKNGGYITALATDPYKKLLYFVDMHTKSLHAISYKLGANLNPITIIQKNNVIMHPSGLSIYENQAFIVNIGAREAVRCQLYDTRNCKAFNLDILNAEDIVVDGASRQPLATNPCNMAKCSGMCVQSDYAYECMCGNKVVGENVNCPSDANNEILASALLSRAETGDSSEGHTTAVICLSLLFVMLLSAAIGYLYYRRFKQGHRDFNINLHFQNPLSSMSAAATATTNGKPTTNIFNNANTVKRDNNTENEGESTKMQFGMPIYRFLRGASSNVGSEILLETQKAKQPLDMRALAQNERMSSIMLEDDADYDNATSHTNYDDEANARLVP